MQVKNQMAKQAVLEERNKKIRCACRGSPAEQESRVTSQAVQRDLVM